MNKNKQKIAIAEACGWKYLPKDSYGIQWVTPPKGTPPKKHVPSAPFAPSDVPDYLNDLNAMHEVEKVLSLDDKLNFVMYLGGLCQNTDPRVGSWPNVAFATASQRAEAFLKTINKWED